MADFFDVEDVVKNYDRHIAGRMISYLKPYKSMVALTLLALVLSTAGELILPVLIQKAIDEVILARYLVVETNSEEDHYQLAQEKGRLRGRAVRIGNRLFIPQAGSIGVSGARGRDEPRRELPEGEHWYLFPYKPESAVMARISGLIVQDGAWAAIRTGDLYKLPIEDIRSLRGDDLSLLVSSAVLFFLILGVILAAGFVQTWTSSLIGQKVMKELRLALFEKTASQSTAFLSRHPVGRIVTRLTGDVETINEFFTSVLATFLKDLSVMVGVLATLFLLSPRLALVALLTLPPVAVVTGISRVKARNAFRRQRTASSRVNAFLSERLSGIQVVQLFAQEDSSKRDFSVRNQELLSANLGEMYVFAAFRPLVDFLATLTVAVIVGVGGMMVMDQSISLGVMIAFINLVGMFFAPVQDIAEKYTLLQSAMAGGERVFALLDTNERIPDTGTRSIEGRVRGHIEFDRVCFSYKNGEKVLRDMSFTVQSGEMVAIVGYTGAGKTTITNVLTRLWDIDSGSIRLDGMPLADIRLDELRRSVLPVLQEVFLFSGSVAENIRMGLPLTDEQVEAAARTVHAHEFISGLPAGYATLLSEGATNISSGQRQLISFARVIAHNPAVVILDEATSSVDTETEHRIQLGIQEVLAGRTSLVIAHRLSTIRHADRILVLSGGRLVENGTHSELIARDGLYAGLYRLQYEHSTLL